ncbi:MAG: ABC transporter permease [Aestuariibacter sp.]
MNTSFRTFNIATNIWVALLVLPMLVVLLSWLQPQWQQWQHLLDTFFAEYVTNTILLAVGVGFFSCVFAVLPAWWVSQYHFPLRRFFNWALLLPLAIPSYIGAYVYVGLLDFAGPIDRLLSSIGLSGSQYLPDIQNLFGTCVVMSLVLYPYVFAIAKVSFSSQSANYRKVAQSNGFSESKFFTKLALPMALPAILAGTSLTMMEAMADFGTVEYMGVVTFTTGIFRTWYGMNNIAAASQLASTLVLFVIILLALERWSRRKQRYFSNTSAGYQRINLSRGKALTISSALTCLFLIAFITPLSLLGYWGYLSLQSGFDMRLLGQIKNTFLVAGTAALIIVMGALLLCYCARLKPGKWAQTKLQLVGSGYAFPGTVIAVGSVMALGWLDHRINDVFIWFNDKPVGLVLSGSAFALVFAYTVRFSTVGLHYIQNGLERITPSIDNAARSLGANQSTLLWRVHLPLLRGSALMALLVVFVDIIKELPATLILRPFNFDTLAVKTYEFAKDERLTDAAVPALLIILVSLIPVLVISKMQSEK